MVMVLDCAWVCKRRRERGWLVYDWAGRWRSCKTVVAWGHTTTRKTAGWSNAAEAGALHARENNTRGVSKFKKKRKKKL